ncbi:uncharacterized protein [Euphorbia lathyris]|uniref:uncharacterized protein isoform X1 n=1 Tax=Euphorbia lathyris TaxID=212925 RepID=UPI003313AE7A
MKCPCTHCCNRKWHSKGAIYDHLICNGPALTLVSWIYDVVRKTTTNDENVKASSMGMNFGDELTRMLHDNFQYIDNDLGNDDHRINNGPNLNAKKFYHLVEEGKQPLYPGCERFSRLSFMVRLYLFKCVHGVSEAAFSDLLELIREAFPNAEVPKSFNAAKNVIKDLGLDYQKIHACPNDCMLYWAENEGETVCKICGASRWKVVDNEYVGVENEKPKKCHKVPAKIMRYFPLKPRLQRLFMCKGLAELMIWYAKERKKDGKLRHPANGEAWKAMDSLYPNFSSEIRNVGLGLASDGFNPFRTMSISHSTWPIVLINYNLPPWLCMKPENLILSTLIPGPTSPGNNIDVYMQPLITELKELWDIGVETYDSFTNQTFTLQANLLWTISDFSAYAMLSGWSTKGKLACPNCHYETSSTYLKHSKKMCYMNHRKFFDSNHKWRVDKRRFNGDIEVGNMPTELSGMDIVELLHEFKNVFGKQKKKPQPNSKCPWKKKSILFELPYWIHNLSRHNLDVMHIEKNVFDNILGTLLSIAGKSKDHLNARLDLQDMGIRKTFILEIPVIINTLNMGLPVLT